MKTLVVSLIGLALLVGSWLVFSDFASDTIDHLTDKIEQQIITPATTGKWDEARESMEEFTTEWDKYKKIFTYFLSTEEIDQTDFSISRAQYYIECQDVSNATGELAYIRKQLFSLHENEKLNLENIF